MQAVELAQALEQEVEESRKEHEAKERETAPTHSSMTASAAAELASLTQRMMDAQSGTERALDGAQLVVVEALEELAARAEEAALEDVPQTLRQVSLCIYPARACRLV